MNEKILKYSPKYYNPKEQNVIYLNLNASHICNYGCLKCLQNKITENNGVLDVHKMCEIIDKANVGDSLFVFISAKINLE